MPASNFLEKPAYPVLFVAALSFIFVGVLAAMFRVNEAGIEQQKREAYERTILSLCVDSLANATGKTADVLQSDYPNSFQTYIRLLPEGSFYRPAYEVRVQNRLLAYVFDIVGKGLWGTMSALVATSPAKDTVIGISVYEQMETPGLGSRIEEPWFRDQFRQKAILDRGNPVDLILIPEGQIAADRSEIRQITGATITSNAVLNMLRNELSQIYNSQRQVRP